MRLLTYLLLALFGFVACTADEPELAETEQAVAASLSSIAITPGTVAIPVQVQQQLKAVGTYSNSSTKNLTATATWSSSNPSVATVSSGGLVTALAPGSATISARSGTITGSASITVTAATLRSIAMSPATRRTNVGASSVTHVIGTFSDGTKFRLTQNMTWAIGASSIATVDANGTVTGVGAGTTTLRVTHSSGLTAKGFVTVGTATLSSVALTPTAQPLPVGYTRAFTVTGLYSDNTTADLTAIATWASSKPTIASLGTDAPNVITALAAGKSTISATVAGKKATAVVTVKAVNLTAITIASSLPMPVGTTNSFVATGTFSDHSTFDITNHVTWASSSAGLAISNAPGSEGVATATTPGSYTLTATDPTTLIVGSTQVLVTPAALTSIAVTPAVSTLAFGSSLALTATGYFTDGNSRDLTAQVTWSADPATIAVSNDAGSNGVAMPLAAGTATVTALDPATGISGHATLTVAVAALVSLAVSPGNATIPNGDAQRFSAVGTYADGTTRDLTALVTWSVNGAATISNAADSAGLATASSVGSNTIVATEPVSGRSATATLTVTAAVLRSLAISPANATIPQGTTKDFSALGTLSDGSTVNLSANVAWSSAHNDVVFAAGACSDVVASPSAVGAESIMAVDPATGIAATTSLTVSALPAGTDVFRFRLLDGNGKIVPPSRVATFPVVGTSSSTVDQSCEGYTTALVAPGQQLIQLAWNGVSGFALPDSLFFRAIVDVESNVTADYTLPAANPTVFHVIDPDGAPVAGASVVDFFADSSLPCGGGGLTTCTMNGNNLSTVDLAGSPAVTDANGNVSLYTFPSAGNYVVARPPTSDLLQFTGSVDTTPGAVTVRLSRPLPFSFRLFDANGALVTGTAVAVSVFPTQGSSNQPVTLDGSGVYSTGVVPGDQLIDIQTRGASGAALPDQLWFRGIVHVDHAQQIDFVLPTARGTVVHVVDPTGAAVPGVSVSNYYQGTGVGCGTGFASCTLNQGLSTLDLAGNPAVTDANGNVSIYMFPSAQNYVIARPQADSPFLGFSGYVDTTSGSATVTLIATYSLTFRLLDARGAAVFGPHVSVGIGPAQGSNSETVTVDDSGVYHARVSAGTQLVLFSTSGAHGFALPDNTSLRGFLDVSGDLTIDLGLPVAIATSVHVVDTSGNAVAGASATLFYQRNTVPCTGFSLCQTGANMTTSLDVNGAPATTDANGNVVMFGFPATDDFLRLTPPANTNYLPTQGNVDTTSGHVDFTLN